MTDRLDRWDVIDLPESKVLLRLIQDALDGCLDLAYPVDIVRTKTRIHNMIEYRNKHGRLPRSSEIQEVLGLPPRTMVGEQLLAGLLENA